MFKAGDKVKIDLKRLYDIHDSQCDYAGKREYHLSRQGFIQKTQYCGEWHYCLRLSHNDDFLLTDLKECSLEVENTYGTYTQSVYVIVHDNGDDNFKAPVIFALDVDEAMECLTIVQKKEKDFNELFEELSDSVTMDDVKSGELLFQKDKTIDGENIDVAIYSYQDKNWLIAYKDCECIAFREYTGEVPQKAKAAEADTPRKRVVQISVDVEIDADENGDVVAEQIAEELEGCGRVVLGAVFREDMTKDYDYEVEL